jgi:hypothetical protein
MANLTPARITYFIGEIEQDIRFHAVISEGHQATSEVTKYPVQTGFQVSNHAIRHNRKVTIEAIITNTLIAGSKTAYQYSLSNNSRTIFNVLSDLVNLKIQTKVLTNLGEYNPVVFTSFRTKQMAGMVDSIKVILTGEELQVSDAINGASPSPVSWRKLDSSEVTARIDSLNAAGVLTNPSDTFEEASFNMGEDFSINSVTSVGKPVVTTYENVGIDPTTGAYTYAIHTTDAALFTEGADIPELAVTNIAAKIGAGAKSLSECFLEGADNILTRAALEYVDTAMGALTRSAYGVFYDVTHMTNSDVGQDMIGMSAGCIVRGITGNKSPYPYQPGESLPIADDIVNGAKNIGKSILGTNNTPSGVPTVRATLTRVTCVECEESRI